MSTPLKFLIFATLLPSLALQGQEPETVDPTAESPEIRTQLDAIRGVEEMQSLKKQIEELTRQNQQLMEKLLEATQKLDAMQSELDAVRQGQVDAARRRSALPELGLVAQIRTDAIRQADISAGERTYRVVDSRPFRLMLSNNETVVATPSFMEDGTIEISIADLDVTQLLAFKPSPPPPPKESSRTRVDDE